MIHPNTVLKFIDETIGYGVFANSFIPQGTIVYVKDSLERVVSPQEYFEQDYEMQEMIEKYSYRDEHGNRVISWDFAKYVNHCCNCNTMSTGYGFEIAIRDIFEGEQITDEYGMFNLDQEMQVSCGNASCRKSVRPTDFDRYYHAWDMQIQAAIQYIFNVEQPLYKWLDQETKKELDVLRLDFSKYKSVYNLKWNKESMEEDLELI